MAQRLLFLFALLWSLSGKAQLIINEVLYDPSNTALDGDANGDGTYDQEEDSFIEFINVGSFNYDASGLQIWDDTTSGSLKYTVPQETLVPPNGAVVVFGGGTPTGNFGGAIILTASASPDGLNLNNSGEVIVIKDGNGQPILSFDSDALSNNPNGSYTRNPDITGAFEQHNDNTLLLFSPGTRIDGTPFNTVYNPPIPTCNPNYNATTQITGNYTVKFSWSNLGYSSYSLNIREVGASTWSSFMVSGLQRTLENRAPGNYEFYVADLSGNDYSCTGTFAVGCATDIAYSYNGFQAPELGISVAERLIKNPDGYINTTGIYTDGLSKVKISMSPQFESDYNPYSNVSEIEIRTIKEIDLPYFTVVGNEIKEKRITWEKYILDYETSNSCIEFDNSEPRGWEFGSVGYERYGHCTLIVYVRAKHRRWEGLEVVRTVMISCEVFL